jgi:hypothetical protein
VFKLKNESCLGYDELTHSFVFDGLDNKPKKLTSRAFPIILGKSKWDSIGKGVLDRCGLLEKEEIDPYYMVRGEIGELLVYDHIQAMYKRANQQAVMKRFTPALENYDMFSSNPKFGGVVDIGVSKPQRAVVEVKSKSEKDIEWIVDKNQPPIEEVMQGKFLARLSKTDRLLMAYVFFTPKQETDIKNMMNAGETDITQIMDGLNLKHTDVRIEIVKHNVYAEEMDEDMEIAYKSYMNKVETKSVASVFFNAEEVAYLTRILEKTNKLSAKAIKSMVSEDDLPF